MSLRERAFFSELIDFSQKNAAKHAELVRFTINPTKMYARTKIAPESCVFVPVVPLQSIQVAEKSSGLFTENHVDIKGAKRGLYLSKPSMPSTDLGDAKMWGASTSISPFWWLTKTHEKKLSNFVLKIVEHKGFKIPIMTNSRAIEANELLCIYEAPEKRESVVVDATAKKKQRVG